MKKKRGKIEDPPIQHKPFWATLLCLFIVSIIAIISYVETPNLTGSASIQSISLITQGQTLHLDIKDVKGVKEIRIDIIKGFKNGIVRVDEIESSTFQGTAFSTFVISSGNLENFGTVSFVLKIKESDLLQSGIAPGDVKLYQKDLALPTERGQDKEGYLYYTVFTQGIGEFTIGRADVVEEVKVEEEIEIKESVKPLKIGSENLGESFWDKFIDFFKNLFK